MKKIAVSALLLICISSNVQADPVVDLQNLLTKINTIQANFKQCVFSDNKKLLHTYTGNMEFKKPNLSRWQVEQPDATLLITDGKKVWNYDHALEQVTVQKYSFNKDVTPLSFVLDGNAKLATNFKVEKLPGKCFKLTPKQENPNFVNVDVCFKDGYINSLHIVDHFEQTSVFEFFQVRNNIKIPDNKFTFTPPAGVDVVGEL